jgi:hypothetical protein
MNDLGALYTRIEADTKGLNKAESHIKAFATRAAASLAAVASVSAVVAGIQKVTMLTARYDTLGIVMDNVGKNAGYSSKQMAEYQSALQKTGISMISARTTMAKMAQAQIDLSKSSDLARVAQDAAVIGNINSSEAFERMIQGIQSAEVEILRNIGINVSFEESYKELAAQLKKNVADLSVQEKTQARVNSVLKAGAGIQGTYAASMNSAGKQWLSLQRYVEDTQVKLGRLFQPSFSTIVKEITDKIKKFSESLDEKTLKSWSEKINGAVSGTINFANSIGELSDKLGSPNLKELSVIAGILVRFGPNAAGAAAGVITLNNSLDNLGLGSVQNGFKSLTGSMQATQNVIDGLSGKRDWNTGKWISEVQQIENKIKELQNRKEPWQLFPDPNETKRNAENIKSQIEALRGSLSEARIKDAIKESIADPWRSAEREAQVAMKAYSANTKRSLNQIEKEYEKHRDAILNINDQIKQNKLSGDQLIRELKREGMSKGSAEADLKKEAQEYVALMEKAKNTWEGLKNAKSKEDVAKKDAAFEDIIKYADVAQSKFLEMDRSSASVKSDVIKNIQGIVAARDQALNASKQVEVNAANALIKESDMTLASQLFDDVKTKAENITAVTYPAMSQAFSQVWAGGQESANIVFTNIEERAKEVGKQISDNMWVVPKDSSEFVGKVKEIGDKFTTVYSGVEEISKKAQSVQSDNIEAVISDLKPLGDVWEDVYELAAKAAEQATSKMLSAIEKVRRAAASVKMNLGGSVSRGYADGGAIQRLKDGGMALWNKTEAIRASTGRFFSGFGGGDKIPILGEAGEYMINKYKVREAGVDTAAAFNTGNWAKVVENLLPKLRLGGPMPSMFPRQALAFGGGVQDIVNNTSESPRNYYINGSTGPISVRASDREADRLLKVLERKYKGRSR